MQQNLTLGATGTTYTAPANGWYTMQIGWKWLATSTTLVLLRQFFWNKSSNMVIQDSIALHPSKDNSYTLRCFIPAKRGQQVQANYATSQTTLAEASYINLVFIYADGVPSA